MELQVGKKYKYLLRDDVKYVEIVDIGNFYEHDSALGVLHYKCSTLTLRTMVFSRNAFDSLSEYKEPLTARRTLWFPVWASNSGKPSIGSVGGNAESEAQGSLGAVKVTLEWTEGQDNE